MLFFYLYKGVGLAHRVFDQSNAMLALRVVFKFSAKNITPKWRAFLNVVDLYLGDYAMGYASGQVPLRSSRSGAPKLSTP